MEQNEKNDVLNKAYENFKVVNDGFKNMIDEFNDVFAERRFLHNEIHWNQNGLESFDILYSQMDEFIKRLVSIDDKQSPAVPEFQKIHTAIKNYINRVNEIIEGEYSEVSDSPRKANNILNKMFEISNRANRKIYLRYQSVLDRNDKQSSKADKFLEYMKDQVKSLVEKSGDILKSYQYKEPKNFGDIRDSMYEIWEIVSKANEEEIDKELVDNFSNALEEFSMDASDFEAIKDAFDAEYEKISETVDKVASLANKKAPLRLKRDFEKIFDRMSLLFIKEDEELSKRFRSIYKDCREVKKECPKWYNFLKAICTGIKVKPNFYTKQTLISVLIASCCATNNIGQADAVCRGLRKITKRAEIKDEVYIKKSEKFRMKIKDKISAGGNIDDLKMIIKTGLNEIMSDNKVLSKVIYFEAIS